MTAAVDVPPVLAEPVRIGPFHAAGQRFVIETDDAEFAGWLAERLADLRTDDEAPAPPTTFLVARRGPAWLSHPWGVWRDGEPCETTVTPDYIGPYVLWEITRLVLERADPLVPIHAAAVSRNGRAIVLAGVSHAGKSTLSAWLTAHGWGFLTDEVALVDTGAGGPVVHPFHRPIGVRRGGPVDELYEDDSPGAEILLPASRLGALAEPAPLVAMVFPQHQEGTTPELQPEPPAAAVRELASHLPTLGSRGRDVFRRIVALVGSVPCYSLAVDDLDAADTVLRTLVEDR